jgi:hypothetical protein
MADDSITVDMSPLHEVKIQSSAPSTEDSGELRYCHLSLELIECVTRC